MKRYFMLLGLIATAFTLTNCTKEIEQPVEAPETNEGIPFEIVASTVSTKTALDGLQTKWVANDQISVFHTEANSETYGTNDVFTITSENLESNRFTGTLTEDLFENNDWYVMYPYKSAWKPNTTNGGVVYLGSRYNEEQTQEGNNDMSHLAGANFPLYGKAKNLPASQSPSIAMSHLTSVIAVTVKNKLSDPLTVLNVKFTATEPIIGGYYISIVEEEPVYTGNGQYVNSTATLNVEDAAEIAFNGEATYYIGIKPFTATTGQQLKISVNGYEKTLTLKADVEFKAGYIKPMTFSYDKIPQTIFFDPSSVAAVLGSDFEEPNLTGAMTAVTYTSSNTSVATVNSSTGEVSLVAAGETTITATVAESNEYQEATASYTLTVSETQPNYYQKVTSITSGKKYLLVAETESGSYVFDSANVKTEMTAIDISSSINSNKIIANDQTNSYAVTISTSGDGYNILLSDGEYLVINSSTDENENLSKSPTAEVISITSGIDSYAGKFLFASTNRSTRGLIFRNSTKPIFKNYAVTNATYSTYCGYLTLYEFKDSN